ncbi:MAG: enoyl-CoA hydratase/isomerase family protein [Proteobacteria bacterium]|nr:enoyl-CoA hydratase/isomerase family protein [Pseudomonadota bacterium]
MEYEDLLFELSDGVATLTLNRPEKLNAFSGAMGRSLGAAYRECDRNDEIRVVILTGAGRAFCSGADLSSGESTFAGAQESPSFRAAAVDPPAWEVRKPVIAAVNGSAVGLGFTLALQADLRLLAREGKYGILQSRRGVMGDAYSHWTLPRLVGTERAAELLITGRRITGDEAERMGLACRVLPAAEVLPAALELAREIAVETAPLSVAVSKKLLWESTRLSWADVGRKETELHVHLMARSDAVEGPMAYLERRRPDWKLRVGSDWPDWPE